ncbi:MAG: hypothetical protein HY774_11260 [Acidobacteria bacterium]|nr:hypothetical protein [Acidobacteriota bacterium]
MMKLLDFGVEPGAVEHQSRNNRVVQWAYRSEWSVKSGRQMLADPCLILQSSVCAIDTKARSG